MNIIKLWIDDVRPAPKGYKWIKTVHEAIGIISFDLDHFREMQNNKYLCNSLHPRQSFGGILLIDLDHDAGNMYKYGGDYIEILCFLEKEQKETGCKIPYKFHIHSMNPVGVQNMRAIIEKNGWKEV